MLNKNTNPLIKLLITSVAATMLTCSAVNASTLTIKNDDTAEVDIIVEPGEGNLMSPSKEAKREILKPGEEKMILVTKGDFDKETFSVTGKVKMPSTDNKCGPLLMDKDYKIVFTGTKAGGTRCVSEEK